MNIIKLGKTYKLAPVEKVFEKLPLGVYSLEFDPTKGEYYLNQKTDFKLPNKLYGDQSIVKRWIKAFNNCSKNMGILLSGTKGSGKTITAQKFCIDSKLPVIIVNQYYDGSGFLDFLSDPILGRFILFIDEFEKIFPKPEDQVDIIQLMDGNYFTNICFLLTVNERNINTYLVNRLNRIKYRKHYVTLEDDVVEDVIKDLLENKDHVKSIYQFFEKIDLCTFDLLVNLINEMNLFKEDAITCGKHFNLEAEQSYYTIKEIIMGKEYDCYGQSLFPGFSSIDIERSDMQWVAEKGKKKVGYPKITGHYVTLDTDSCKIEKISTNTMIITNEEINVKFVLNKRKNEYLIF